ncbi:unnamed protein product [Schistocephalus solidus]|uniref:Uncharacterized protein n=1 Tax=Schistocephalus solidus TaxID=70667 RepID=A0A183SF62_SCHSO|nr:unnamed protein product [Schistocephalus solidus]
MRQPLSQRRRSFIRLRTLASPQPCEPSGHPTFSAVTVATSVNGCFVCGSKAFNVCIMQPLLLGQQMAEGCIFVIKPVLVLTTCAIEDIQGVHLDCVPQLTSSVFNGGVLFGD